MVFWFSGTGNSRHVAIRLASYFRERAVSIADAVQNEAFSYDLAKGEKLGVVTPVYFWGLPDIVKTFLQKLTINGQKEPYTYAVFVCGGSSCNAVGQMSALLRLDYSAELVMPDNYVLMNDVRHPDEIRACLANADAALGKIYNAVKQQKKEMLRVGLLGSLLTRMTYPHYDKTRHTAPFHVTNKCAHCGFCASVCPDRAIELIDGKPVWRYEQCDLCLACLNRCPQEAIQYGRHTEKRKRYIHPELRPKQGETAVTKDSRFF